MTHWRTIGRQYEPVDWVKWWIQLTVTVVGIVVFYGIVFAAFVLFLLIYEPNRAAAHEWYPPLCCSGGDCSPLDPKRVIELTAGGFLIDNRFYVPQKDVGPSLDGRYHACFPKPDDMRCFFAPGRGI